MHHEPLSNFLNFQNLSDDNGIDVCLMFNFLTEDSTRSRSSYRLSVFMMVNPCTSYPSFLQAIDMSAFESIPPLKQKAIEHLIVVAFPSNEIMHILLAQLPPHSLKTHFDNQTLVSNNRNYVYIFGYICGRFPGIS